MTNTCKNCEEIVIPNPDDGSCPKCGAKAGYTVLKTWNITQRIGDQRETIKSTIDKKFQEYDEYIKQGKNAEFYKILKESLKEQIPEFLKKSEKEAKKRLETEKEKHQVSFTIDGIVGIEEQRKIKELEEYIEELKKNNDELSGKLSANQLISNEMIKNIENISTKTRIIYDRLTPTKTVITAVGIGIIASFIASLVFSKLFPT